MPGWQERTFAQTPYFPGIPIPGTDSQMKISSAWVSLGHPLAGAFACHQAVDCFMNLSLMSQKWILVSIMFIGVFQVEHGIAQSLTGTTGLLTIPTAEMLEDGEISFGMSLINKKYLVLFDQNKGYHGMANYVTLGYLPFLEISARLTRLLDYSEPQALGDRMASIRLRLLEENGFFPSVVLGAHSLLGASRYFNASYLVASKSFRRSHQTKMGIHLGYGVGWIEAKSHQFVGLFGGVSLSPRPFITLMLEHDAEKFNWGMRLSLLGPLELLVVLLNFDTFSGGISYKFQF